MAATYEGNEPAAVYGNGSARNDGGGHEPWSLGDNAIMIGDRKEQWSYLCDDDPLIALHVV